MCRKREREEACPHVLTLMGQYLIIWNSSAVFCNQGCSSLLEHLQGRQVIKLLDQPLVLLSSLFLSALSLSLSPLLFQVRRHALEDKWNSGNGEREQIKFRKTQNSPL